MDYTPRPIRPRPPLPPIYLRILGRLRELAGPGLDPLGKTNPEPLGQLINDVVLYHDDGDLNARDARIEQLSYLAGHLHEVRTADPGTYRQLRRKLRVARNFDEYEAARFELYTAAKLLRIGCQYARPDPPDFALCGQWSGVSIECTTIHLVTSSAPSIDYKIASAIRGKAAKPYATPACALFIDVSDYFYRTNKDRPRLDRDGFRHLIQSELARVDLGAVVLFTTSVLRRPGGMAIATDRIREDSPRIDPTLRAFLEAHYLGAPVSRRGVGFLGSG